MSGAFQLFVTGEQRVLAMFGLSETVNLKPRFRDSYRGSRGDTLLSYAGPSRVWNRS
jgi:hypothetical protein